MPWASSGAFGVVHNWLTTAATGAVRPVSWNKPWKIWFAACAAGDGVAAANALVIPAVSGTVRAVTAAAGVVFAEVAAGAARVIVAKATRFRGSPASLGADRALRTIGALGTLGTMGTMGTMGVPVTLGALAACAVRTASLGRDRATS